MDTSRAGLKEVSQEESESGAYVLGDDEHDDDDEDHDEDDDGQERRDTAGVFWQKALPRVELGTFALRVRRSAAKLQRRGDQGGLAGASRSSGVGKQPTEPQNGLFV